MPGRRFRPYNDFRNEPLLHNRPPTLLTCLRFRGYKHVQKFSLYKAFLGTVAVTTCAQN